jgi:signal transduction histidine kinase
VTIDVDDSIIDGLDMQKLGVIFYLVEEAVNNARKHAQAEHIWVKLKHAKKDVALLEIRDDGVGFDVKAVQSSYDSRGSLGMVNLKERAEMINGILQIRSKPGEGTLIQIGIPLTQEAVERLWHTK